MGQQEVYSYLVYKRSKSEAWYTIAEIKAELLAGGMSNGALKGVANDLYKLATWGQIQVRGKGLWEHVKTFRAYNK